jgi:hypothetical protein
MDYLILKPSIPNSLDTCRFYLQVDFRDSEMHGATDSRNGPVSAWRKTSLGKTDLCPSVSSGYTKYLQNVQQIMQKGRAKVDLAIYHSAVEGVKGGLKSSALTEAGYTYGFPSDGLLAREDAAVKDGKLWVDGPGYKVCYTERGGATYH